MDIDHNNIDKLCRICLEIADQDKINLNTEVLDGISVQGMIIALSVDDESNDEDDQDEYFPIKICNNCLKRLKDAYELQQTIINSRKRVKELLVSKNEEISETEELEFVAVVKEEQEEDKNGIDDSMDIDDDDDDDEEILFKPCTDFVVDEKKSQGTSDKKITKNPALTKNNKIKISKLSKFECGLCDKVYADLKAFRTHFRSHTGLQRHFLCSFCSKTFADKAGLDKHVKRKHTEEGYNKHQCPYCPRKTSDITHLRTHIQTHTGEKPDICQTCGKSFNGRNALRMHMQLHVTEKNFKCRFCEQAFKMKRYLERHEMVHLNIKPYECEVCGSAFTQQGDLLKHLKQHKMDTSYKCDRCDKSFRLKTELRRHMVAHPRDETT